MTIAGFSKHGQFQKAGEASSSSVGLSYEELTTTRLLASLFNMVTDRWEMTRAGPSLDRYEGLSKVVKLFYSMQDRKFLQVYL